MSYMTCGLGHKWRSLPVWRDVISNGKGTRLEDWPLQTQEQYLRHEKEGRLPYQLCLQCHTLEQRISSHEFGTIEETNQLYRKVLDLSLQFPFEPDNPLYAALKEAKNNR